MAAVVIIAVASLAALVVQNYINSKERARLVRLAVAETKSERIAALLPERKPKAPKEPSSDVPVQPTKPIGI